MMKGPGRLVPDLVLERFRLLELEEARAAVLRDAMAEDEVLQQRLAALERSDAELLEAFPPGAFAEEVRRREAAGGSAVAGAAAEGARPPFLPLAAALALGLVLAVGLSVGPRVEPPGPGRAAKEMPRGDRAKGGSPDLVLYRRRGELAVERLAPGAVARAHDLVQIAYQAGGQRFGVIVSLDGRGVVTRHLPSAGDEAAPLQPGGAVALATAYRLDDAPRLERFYLIASERVFSVSSVLTTVSRAGLDPATMDRLPLGAEFAQASFLLRKE